MGNKVLSKKDLLKVEDFLYEVRKQWYDIGVGLGVGKEEIDALRDKYEDPSVCLREMLALWLESDNPTWQALKEVLASPSVNEQALAARGNWLATPLKGIEVVTPIGTVQIPATKGL